MLRYKTENMRTSRGWNTRSVYTRGISLNLGNDDTNGDFVLVTGANHSNLGSKPASHHGSTCRSGGLEPAAIFGSVRVVSGQTRIVSVIRSD